MEHFPRLSKLLAEYNIPESRYGISSFVTSKIVRSPYLPMFFCKALLHLIFFVVARRMMRTDTALKLFFFQQVLGGVGNAIQVRLAKLRGSFCPVFHPFEKRSVVSRCIFNDGPVTKIFYAAYCYI